MSVCVFCVFLCLPTYFFATPIAYINTETEICTKKINNIYTYVCTKREEKKREREREEKEKLATGSNKRMKFITMNTLQVYGELFHFCFSPYKQPKKKVEKKVNVCLEIRRKKNYSTIVKSSGVLYIKCVCAFCSVKASNKKVHERKYPFAFILPIKMKIISNIYFIRTNKEKPKRKRTRVSEWRLMERVRNNWCKWSRNNTHTHKYTTEAQETKSQMWK